MNPMTHVLRPGLACAALWIALLHAVAAHASPMSLDCTKAEGAVEQAICNGGKEGQDGKLAALDREMGRVYDLANKAPGTSRTKRFDLVARQRDWIARRNDCAKSTALQTCVRDAYVARIAELREMFPSSRDRKGQGGLSIGPVAVMCPGKTALRATFVNVAPPLAYLSGKDLGLVLDIAQSGSGARYDARSPAGDALFWQKGPQAFVQLPGGPQQTCKVGAIG